MLSGLKVDRLAQSLSSLNALESSAFRTYLGGQGISAAGTGMQQVALAWLVYRTTHSAWALGALTIAALLGQFITSFAGGYLADKCDRKQLLIRLQWVGAIISIALAIAVAFNIVNIPVILGASLLLGGFLGMEYPVRQSLNVHLVKPDHALSARGLYASVVSSSVALGQATAGILIDALPAIGEMTCLLLNAVSYLFSLLMLGKITMLVRDHVSATASSKPSEPTEQSPSALISSEASTEKFSLPDQIKNVMRANAECFRYVISSEVVLFSFLQTIVLVLFGMRYIPLLPAFAAEVFDGGARASGILTGAVALGYAAGALICGSLKNKHRLGIWADLSLFLLPLALLLFCQAEQLHIGLCCVILMAVCQSANVNASICLLQVSSPDALFGRLMGFRVMVVALADLLGAAAVTSVVHKFGLTKTTIVAAFICVALAILLFSRRAIGGVFLNAFTSGASMQPAPEPVTSSTRIRK